MKVNEIFLSINGETLSSGFPTIFVRFAECNLRCSYCDSAYAYEDGCEMSIDEIIEKIRSFEFNRVCLTGGEPLLQKDLLKLIERLNDYEVSVETNGSMSIEGLVRQNHHAIIMDLKVPSSNCSEMMCFENFKHLRDIDEIKIVIGSRADYDWAKDVLRKYHNYGIITISPIYGAIDYSSVVSWILEDRLDVRFQLQIQKIIWPHEKRGV